ncbi:tetratricopeptide repeat protein [Candidatus Gracilibacteria bacterium]|nr:tetratricopeptide repeat protein [Candidatus Gracilibacteria bacterium]
MIRSIRTFLTIVIFAALVWLGNATNASAQVQPADIADPQQELGELVQKAFAATNEGNFPVAEKFWTEIIDKFPTEAAAWSNRGNSRVSQNKLQAAISDYEKAIELAPEAPDPYLNRGTALEGLGRWSEAIADYNRVLELDPKDPAAYNNRGNAEAGLGEWGSAISDYEKAFELAPEYAFARANHALALYQNGQTEAAIRNMKNIVRRYPKFADMRAALSACLWAAGQRGEAESNWVAAVGLDERYKDIDWVKNIRRWPPVAISALDKFCTCNKIGL